mgnify:CR=1 FL=1
MKSMKNILLLTDFSDNALHAVEYAIRYFEEKEVTFHLLHVKDMRGFVSDDLIGASTGTDVYETIIGGIKKELKKVQEYLEGKYNSPGHTFKTKTVYSPFFDAVRDYSKKEKIDMIVMGTKGATGAKQVFVGSTTSKIINRMDVPVLAIPEDYDFQPIKKVLFPLDFKVDFLPITLLPLLELLDRYQPNLKIVYLDETQKELTDEQKLNREETERIFKGYHFSLHTVRGLDLDSALSCLSEFLQTQMIVMIKKERSFVQRVFKGTHIRKVSYHIKVPLLVLPESKVLQD